jgi:hypothetical protein
LALTNIDHVQQPVQIIVSEFGLDEITVADRSEGSSSDSGRQTVKVVIDNTIERARNKICEEAVQKVLYMYVLCIPYFPAYKTHRPIKRTLIFSLEILEKIMMNVF